MEYSYSTTVDFSDIYTNTARRDIPSRMIAGENESRSTSSDQSAAKTKHPKREATLAARSEPSHFRLTSISQKAESDIYTSEYD